MEIAEKARELIKNRRWAVFMTVCGCAGLLLIMISSIVPGRGAPERSVSEIKSCSVDAEKYCRMTEEKLERFLADISGAGAVKVYITVGSDQRYVYATEGRKSRSSDRSEEEEKYVIIGSGSEKNALIETVEVPAITGAVIACEGGESPKVCEQIYKSVSAALNIPTSNIFVTKLR